MRSLPLLFVLSLTASLSAQQPQVSLVRVTGGLDQPVAITNAGDSRLFITQQTGKIVIWDGTRILPAPFLDLTSIISSGGERGLLSVAFHPRYRDNGRFYVCYTNKSGDIE